MIKRTFGQTEVTPIDIEANTAQWIQAIGRAPRCTGDHSIPSEFMACDRCEQHVHIDDLDWKPERFDTWWWVLLPTSWANWLLTRAADRGEDFGGGYCGWCFGPGYKSVKEERDHG